MNPLSRRTFIQQTSKMSLLAPFLFHSSSENAEGAIVPGPKNKLCTYSATRLAQMIREKEVSSEEVVTAFLERIEEVNPTINAVVQLDPRAIENARAADQMLANGTIMGPLHGVPMTIKDSFDTAGVISTGGTKGRENYVPDKDATAVARLKTAGGILMGKTNTPEFTMAYFTSNKIYGTTRNPYNTHKSPGGSSGGAAALLAACGTPIEIGSDTGGSLRVPPHYCGICGLKPTATTVPLTGHIISYTGQPMDELTVLGPLARNVEDLELILNIIAGPDGEDPNVGQRPWHDPAKVDLTKLRFAYHMLNAETKNRNNLLKTIDVLSPVVQSIEQRQFQSFNGAYQHWDHMFVGDGGKYLRNLYEQSGTSYNELSDSFRGALNWASTRKRLNGDALEKAVVDWREWQKEMLKLFDRYDIILTPVIATDNSVSTSSDINRARTYTVTHNTTGWPAAVVRAGVDNFGVPMGIQIIGAPYREDQVIAVAKYLENALGGWRLPGLEIKRNDDGLTVERLGGGKTEMAPSLDGPWTTVISNPLSIQNENGAQYFRQLPPRR